MTPYNQNVGKFGEDIASNYLLKKGFDFIAKNYATRYGEIDLIFQDKAEIVFVEVKTRKSKKYGKPQESVTKFKQRNLIRTAQAYLKKHKQEESDWRIDVVAILLNEDNKPEIEYIENAVTYF